MTMKEVLGQRIKEERESKSHRSSYAGIGQL